MKKLLLFCCLQFLCISIFAQTDREKAFSLAEKAVAQMDEGHIEESIMMLKESQKLDPESIIYPYEIAYAHILKEDFQTASKIYRKLKKHKDVDSQVYQMLGNCYSYLGKPKKAIKTYEEGMMKFPDAANLHLEKGNVFLHQKKYSKAIENYERGIETDPNYSSNYFRLAILYLNSTNKFPGLIYGEIFMNLERNSLRTREMSERLFHAYQSVLYVNKDKSKVNLCNIKIDLSVFENADGFKMPFCAWAEKHFLLAALEEEKLNLSSLSRIRTKFLEGIFEGDKVDYPNGLFDFQKKMLDKNLFDSYNHYIFQIGNESEFDRWEENHQQIFNYFLEWYSNESSMIHFDEENIFLRK